MYNYLHLSLFLLLCSACGLTAAEQDAAEPSSPRLVPLSEFEVMDDLELTVWAESPLLFNPANMDIDRHGRIWVAEGRNYRRSRKDPKGDRIVVVSDTDGDGKADASHVFVQEEMMFTPLGVAVIDNKVVVSQPPDLIVYTDVNRNAVFEPDIDKREVLLTGWGGKNHDHSLHSLTVAPSGQWIFNTGNAGGHHVKGPDGTEYKIGSFYRGRELSGQPSWDGHVYLGGVAFRMNPDGSGLRVIGHNFRNSYEQVVTSFGDVFQNDNDDPPAARTTWLMEHGNLGYTSPDGKRKWGADRRPGQSVQVAEWRQEDPGIIPAGDVYGGGAPTGIAFNESDLLGEKYRGMLLSCEPARNRVFAYFPEPVGAGKLLKRSDFITSNPEEEFAGVDFKRGRVELKMMFRPSDVAVGPDGAIYVADWFDKRVGGHGTHDKDTYGAIYRIAPKGFEPKIKTFDESTIDGAVTALRSPAVNVRAIGFNSLKARGEAAVPAVASLLKDDNPYIQARAVWLLAQLGRKGEAAVERILNKGNETMRVAAFRALKHIDKDVVKHAHTLSKADSEALQREAALAMRDRPFAQSKEILLTIAQRYDGEDRWMLEAIGIGVVGHETEFYDLLREKMGPDPEKWSPEMADLAWRLHPDHALPDIVAYIRSDHSTDEQKKKMLTAIAYIRSAEAAATMTSLADSGPESQRSLAQWWVSNRRSNDWKEYLKEAEPVVLEDMRVPEALGVSKGEISVEQVMALKGDAEKGKALAASCFVCHEISGKGVSFGPDLTAFGKANGPEIIAKSMVTPSADIAHDFDGLVITTTTGKTIEGLKVAEGDPLVVKVFGGSQVAIPKNQIKTRAKAKRSFMVSAEDMGLTAQDVADITAYLRTVR